MNNIEMTTQSERLLDIIGKANAADEKYRRRKAEKTLALMIPTDGGKKPTEAAINAMLDTDDELSALRTERNQANAKMTVAKMAFESWSRDVPANGPGPLLG